MNKISVKNRKDIPIKLWNDFINRDLFSNIFSQYELIDIFEQFNKGDDCSLVILDEKSNKILAMHTSFIVNIGNTVFKEIISLPYAYGTFSGDKKYLKYILDYISNNLVKSNIIRHRIILNAQNSYYINFLKSYGFNLTVNTIDFSISLEQTYDDFLQSISSGNRNDIKRVLKKDEIDVKNIILDKNSLKEFYNLYTQTMIRNNVKSYYSMEYFYRISEKINIYYIAAYYGDQLIGGRLHIVDDHKKIVYYMWGAYDKKYFKLMPNAVLYNYCFKFFKQLCYKSYRLGGTMLDIENNKLIKHKLQWTSNIEPIFLVEKRNKSILSFIFYSLKFLRSWFK